MNRVGVVKSLSATVKAAYAPGELVFIDTTGVVVTAANAASYAPQTMVEVFVGLNDGSLKQVGTINPHAMSFKSSVFVPAVQKTVRVGYDGAINKLISIDPTVATSINKFGTLSLVYTDLLKLTIPSWGDTFSQDVYIVNGDTVATLYAKLQTAGTKIAAKVNAAYGVGTVTFTSGAPVLNAASSFLQFVFASGMNFSVTLDGIFDGTVVKTTVIGTTSGLEGADVIARETEGAILDGYNPVQGRNPMFDLVDYIGGVSATDYDGILVTTTLPKEYESPDAPTGWDVTFELFTTTGAGVAGANTTAVLAVLNAIKVSNGSLDKASAGLLYAPHA